MYVIKNLRRANAENYMFRNQTQLQVCKNALHTYWVYSNLGLLAVASLAPSLGQIPPLSPGDPQRFSKRSHKQECRRKGLLLKLGHRKSAKSLNTSLDMTLAPLKSGREGVKNTPPWINGNSKVEFRKLVQSKIKSFSEISEKHETTSLKGKKQLMGRRLNKFLAWFGGSKSGVLFHHEIQFFY